MRVGGRIHGYFRLIGPFLLSWAAPFFPRELPFNCFPGDYPRSVKRRMRPRVGAEKANVGSLLVAAVDEGNSSSRGDNKNANAVVDYEAAVTISAVA